MVCQSLEADNLSGSEVFARKLSPECMIVMLHDLWDPGIHPPTQKMYSCDPPNLPYPKRIQISVVNMAKIGPGMVSVWRGAHGFI